jgi:hypothetical protein
MLANLLDEVGGRGLGVLLGMLIGSTTAWVLARRRRMRERQSVLEGDARDTVVIHQHLIEACEFTDGRGQRQTGRVLRVRTLGQSELNRVVPNGHLASILIKRAHQVTAQDALISMDGPEGSYLLETLTNFVCDRSTCGAFPHDIYVMTACCEPAALAHHQPITILLVRRADLPLSEDWKLVRGLLVEHGSDGSRILTLMEMAQRFRREQQHIAALRAEGKRTAFVETMYVLDLALDQHSAPLDAKPVPWGRYEDVLKSMNLDPAS